MIEEDRRTFKLNFKDQRRIINKEITLLDLVVEKEEEIEKLNNIINELEKWLKEKQILYGINTQGFSWGVCGEALDKLQELKGVDKE